MKTMSSKYLIYQTFVTKHDLFQQFIKIRKKENFIRNTPNFTIFVKNDIEFKRFKIKQ